MSRRACGAVVLAASLSVAQVAASQVLADVPFYPAMLAAGAAGGLGARATQGYLGVDIRDVSEEQIGPLKLKEARGAEVTRVDHDGPAGKMGLREHDVILQMNGQAVEGEEQLRRMLRETPAGRPVSLLISRDGQQQTMNTQLANREEVERQAWQRHMTVPEPAGAPDVSVGGGIRGGERSEHTDPGPRGGMGFFGGGGPSGSISGGRGDRAMMGTLMVGSSNTGAMLETVGPQLAEFFGVPGGAGLLVRSVEANSPAALAGIKAGDVVVKLNQVPVATGSDWMRVVHESKGRPISVVVMRDKHEQILTMTPDGKRRSAAVWPEFSPTVDGPPEAQLAYLRSRVREMQREMEEVE